MLVFVYFCIRIGRWFSSCGSILICVKFIGMFIIEFVVVGKKIVRGERKTFILIIIGIFEEYFLCFEYVKGDREYIRVLSKGGSWESGV